MCRSTVPTVQSVISNVLDDRAKITASLLSSRDISPLLPPLTPPIARLNLGESRIIRPSKISESSGFSPGSGISLVSPIPRPGQGHTFSFDSVPPGSMGTWSSSQRLNGNAAGMEFSPRHDFSRTGPVRSSTLEDPFFIPASAFTPTSRTPSSPAPSNAPSLHYFFEIEALPLLTDEVRNEFRSERCPLCMKSGVSTNSLVQMRCRMLRCRHIAHSECLSASHLEHILRTHSNIFVRVRMLQGIPENPV